MLLATRLKNFGMVVALLLDFATSVDAWLVLKFLAPRINPYEGCAAVSDSVR
jgi:hypothetical protein